MAEPAAAAEPLASARDGVQTLRDLAALGHQGVAATVAEIRQRTGLGQGELAMLVGVEQSVLAIWEAGHIAPRLHHLSRIVEVLDQHERAAGPGSCRP
jgi:DNA-binding transcriptional regulator YiaG